MDSQQAQTIAADEGEKHEVASKKLKRRISPTKNVTEPEVPSPTELEPSQKNVTARYFCDNVTEPAQNDYATDPDPAQLPVGSSVSPSGTAEATPNVDSDVTDVTSEQENVTSPEKSEPIPAQVTECVEAFKTVADVDEFDLVCEKYLDIYDQAWKLLDGDTQDRIIELHESVFGVGDEFLENCLSSEETSQNPAQVTECVEALKTVTDFDDFYFLCEQYPDIYDQAWKLLDSDTQARIIQLHESLFGDD